jgi:ankyrin repeat protein
VHWHHVDADGCSALHWAVMGDMTAIRSCLTHGVDVTLVNNDGRSALDVLSKEE